MSVKWQSLEFDYYEKDWLWYGIAVTVGAVLFIIAVWQKNFLFAVFIAVAVLMIIVWGGRRPRLISHELDEKHLTIDDKRRELKDFEGFYLENNLLVLKNSGRFGSYLKIRINRDAFDKIKKLLQKNLSEVEYQEPLTDFISRRLGF